MLMTIALIILALWIIGFAVHIGGGLIHLLLLIGLLMLIAHFIGGRRRSTL